MTASKGLVKLKIWTHFLLALAAAIFAAAGGGAIFHLFGASLMWLLVFFLGAVFGAIAYATYRSPVLEVLFQILDGVQILVNGRFESRQPPLLIKERPETPEDEDDYKLNSVVVFPRCGRIYDSYKILIRSQDGPNFFVQTWDWNSDVPTATATDNPDSACPFATAQRAQYIAWLVYLMGDRKDQIEVVGVSRTKSPTPSEL